MQRAASLGAFLKQPAGTFLAGRAWVYFCVRPDLFIIVFFGRLARDDVEALTGALAVELSEQIAPHRSLVDARLLRGADPGAFEALGAYVVRHGRQLSAQVTRNALVRPEGMTGALVAGFYNVVARPYPVSVFEDCDSALAWLGEPPSPLAKELAAAVDHVAGVDTTVGALRGLLAANLDLSAVQAGRALAMSERSLQRRLQGAGTSFRKELLAARLDEARRRLLDGDDPVSDIALEVGFSSLQHFSNAFRLATGDAPTAWRSRLRNNR
jgi:AraC-like DNA-binding protein